MNVYVLIVLTAVVTGLATAGIAIFVAREWWRRRLSAALEAKLDQVGQELREQVRAGVVEGVSQSVGTLPKDVIRKTTRSVTQTGMDIVEEGLSTFLGSPKHRR